MANSLKLHLINKLLLIFFSGLLCFVFSACQKTPGQGGNSSIKGNIWVQKYDPYFSILQYEYAGQDMAVELTFGDNTSPDMSSQTNSNGEFEFIYLRKGKYKVTVYSKTFQNSQNPTGMIPVERTIIIDKRKASYNVGTLVVKR
ncbi:MAG: hypothetical protein JWO32_1876 [Bacteroidetes bacterium]|nr:hypothetical protein [Bacteroidota bacterium]